MGKGNVKGNVKGNKKRNTAARPATRTTAARTVTRPARTEGRTAVIINRGNAPDFERLEREIDELDAGADQWSRPARGQERYSDEAEDRDYDSDEAEEPEEDEEEDGDYSDEEEDYDSDEAEEPEEDEEEPEDAEDEGEDEDEYTADSYLAGQRIPLPSGKHIRVRPMSLISMIENGTVPNSLLPAAKALVYGKKAAAPSNRYERRHANAAPETDTRGAMRVVDFLCCKLVASFRVSMRPQETCPPGVVSVASMFEADKMAIAEFALKGQKALSRFR